MVTVKQRDAKENRSSWSVPVYARGPKTLKIMAHLLEIDDEDKTRMKLKQLSRLKHLRRYDGPKYKI